MRAIRAWRRLAPVILTLVLVGCGTNLQRLAEGQTSQETSHQTSAGPVLRVQAGRLGPAIPSGFVGLSLEYKGFEAYAGQNPRAIDPVFLQLLRDIAPNQKPVLRIGGDSTDWTWYPVAHMRRPLGIRYDLTTGWLHVLGALTRALTARLILGINLEADSRRLAGAEADALVRQIGRSSIEALELGNEPELYDSYGWYRTASGVEVPGRPRGYNVPQYSRDFSGLARSLPAVTLAGPSAGGPRILARLGRFLGDQPRVRLATLHAYPLKHCVRSQVVTADQLLSNASSRGLADYLQPYLATARRHGDSLRIDEMNGISCGGERGVSDTFTSALWVLDTLFELARIGVGGVNVHTVPGTINEILGPKFVNGRWQVHVHPEYYGLIMFAQAAPAGAQLLPVSGQVAVGVKVWATRGPDGHLRVVLINKRTGRPDTIRLQVPAVTGPASVEQLQAPSVHATSGVTLGGQGFGSETTTGVLSGRLLPSRTLAPAGSSYVVRLPAASATLLTFQAR